jgi:hypothetical protein
VRAELQRTIRQSALFVLVVYFVIVVITRLWRCWEPFAIDGDQHQSIGEFWRYHIAGAMPPGHLFVDYAFAYHAPPVWWLVMASLSTLFGPLVAAKLLAFVAYFGASFGAMTVVWRRAHPVLGCAVGMLAVRSPDLPEWITGGMARSLAPTLFYAFALAFFEKRHKTALVILVVMAGVYPSVVIPCGIAYGAYCLVAGPTMRDRLRRCAGMFVAGLLIIGLGEAQELKSPHWWGDIVSYDETLHMPAWQHNGRFPEVPHRDPVVLVERNLERGFKKIGPTPDFVDHFVDAHFLTLFIFGPIGAALLAFAVGRARWPRLTDDDDDNDHDLDRTPRFPWQPLLLFAATMVSYAIVRVFAFKLFLPARQLAFTEQYILMIFLPVLAYWGACALFTDRIRAALWSAALTVLPTFLLCGLGFGIVHGGYQDHPDDRALFEAVRKLPLDDEVACDIQTCELMMTLGQHAPFAARNLVHPLRKGFYEEAERRLVAEQAVLYATDKTVIADFVRDEGVRWFAYDVVSVEGLDPLLYNPAYDKVLALFAPGVLERRVLADPPDDAVVFREGSRVLVDLAKIKRAPE